MKQSDEQDIQRLFVTKVSFCYRESDDSRSEVLKEKTKGKEKCGYTIHADLNGAINIAKAISGFAAHWGTT
ncbi:hypothetical protein V2J23_13480 [Geobacillus thermoleovorans]|uniref:hypothetical protein n=1 Tax=Geobacillus thermoleovorans TaxID=33941 RepID=UPI00345B4D74